MNALSLVLNDLYYLIFWNFDSFIEECERIDRNCVDMSSLLINGIGWEFILFNISR